MRLTRTHNMLTRVDDFFGVLDTPAAARETICASAANYALRSGGMMHENDYVALGALLLRYRPERMFEIGTFRGVTSDFCLSLEARLQIVSIAYLNAPGEPRRYNNSSLRPDQVGSQIDSLRRERFTQLIGDSHQIRAADLEARFGAFDFVLIDGDHSTEGVRSDTELAINLTRGRGVVCWHDANPKAKYQTVREFLATSSAFTAIATGDTYIGGIAFWDCYHGTPTRNRIDPTEDSR